MGSLGLHARYFPSRWTNAQCSAAMKEVCDLERERERDEERTLALISGSGKHTSSSKQEKLHQIYEIFPPAFRFHFLETSAVPCPDGFHSIRFQSIQWLGSS